MFESHCFSFPTMPSAWPQPADIFGGG